MSNQSNQTQITTTMKKYQATIETVKLVREKSDIPKVKIMSSRDVKDYMLENFYDEDIEIFESMFAIYLNKINNTMTVKKISQGGTCGTVVDIKLIAKYGIEILAQNCILCHNHPSGNIQPSQADKDITKKIKEGLKLLDIALLDHVIVTSNNYFSFADEGYI